MRIYQKKNHKPEEIWEKILKILDINIERDKKDFSWKENKEIILSIKN